MSERAATALRHRRRGQWVGLSWAEVSAAVAGLTAGWRSLGLERGERVLFLISARPRTLFSLLAVQAAGGTPLVVDPGVEPARLRELLETVSVRFAVAGGEEQADAILQSGFSGPILYDQPRGLAWRQERQLVSLDSVGGQPVPGDDEEGPVEIATLAPDGWRLALIHTEARHYTPKDLPRLVSTDTVMLAEPLAEPASLALVVGRWLAERHELLLPESGGDLAELAPTCLAGSAELFERLRAGAVERFGGGWRRALIDRAFRAPSSWLSRLLVLRPLRRVLGLRRVRQAVAAGAPDPSTSAFFAALGIAVVPAARVAAVALVGAPLQRSAG
jgi:long-subunit acyl-CoA synthetase (AMP-forming)